MLDECLVARVHIKSTGANVHDVANWLAIYVSNNELYEVIKTDEVLNRIKTAEQTLRQFEYTGQIKRPS